MAGEEYVVKSDFWIIMGTILAAISAAWGWLLNKVWGNQREVAKVKKELDKDLDQRAERIVRVFEQFRKDQKDDLRDTIDPLRDEITRLSNRIDQVIDGRRR